MKKLKIIMGVILCVALAGCAAYGIYTQIGRINFGEIVIDSIPQKSDSAVRVMSFNLRCTNDDQGSITNRSQIATEVIAQYAPDSFGVQECTPRWKRILSRALSDKYACVGSARDFYGPFTEYSSVYYLKDKYNLLDSGTIWLSETPEKRYTKSFGSKCYRVASWAVLENKQTGETYTHLNTHLDHTEDSVREGQIQVLIDKVAELKKNNPVVCTGDFNAYENSKVYSLMCENMTDTKTIAKNSDTGITFSKYGTIEEHEKGAIDFIFVSDNVTADTYKIIRNTVEGMYPSDHYPLIADVNFS